MKKTGSPGFTLVESLISMALITVMLSSVAYMLNVVSRQNQLNDSKMEFLQMQIRMRQLIRAESRCNGTLKDIVGKPVADYQNETDLVLFDSSGQNEFLKGNTQHGTLNVESVKMRIQAPNKSMSQATIAVKAKGKFDFEFKPAKMDLFLAIDATNKVVGCYTFDGLSEGPVCEAAGFFWNEQIQKCVPSNQVLCEAFHLKFVDGQCDFSNSSSCAPGETEMENGECCPEGWLVLSGFNNRKCPKAYCAEFEGKDTMSYDHRDRNEQIFEIGVTGENVPGRCSGENIKIKPDKHFLLADPCMWGACNRGVWVYEKD